MHLSETTSLSSAWRQWRTLALAIFGLATGFFDAYLLRSLGIGFTVNGLDATPLVGAYFGISFALLGWLSGLWLRTRDRERLASAVIQEQSAALDAARRRLSETEKLAALGQLSAAIAHEVRNPLGVIRSAAQSLGETPADGDDARRAAAFIVSEADRLNGVVSSVLAFARPLKVQRRPSPVEQIIDRALLLVRDDVATKRIRLERRAGAEATLLDVDPDLVTQALFSLLHNAVESVGDGGAIRLATAKEASTVAIEVDDTGPGIPAELRGRIFEPFFTTRPHGTGLGLAIVRQIVEAHEGTVAAGDAVGGGACFTVRLPLAAAAG